VIDQMDVALAVFSPSGHLVMSNLAYGNLWAHDPSERLERSTLRNLAAHWRATTVPSGLWSEFEDYVATLGDRVSWNATARLLDGRVLACTFSPLAGGQLWRPSVRNRQQRSACRSAMTQGLYKAPEAFPACGRSGPR